MISSRSTFVLNYLPIFQECVTGVFWRMGCTGRSATAVRTVVTLQHLCRLMQHCWLSLLQLSTSGPDIDNSDIVCSDYPDFDNKQIMICAYYTIVLVFCVKGFAANSS